MLKRIGILLITKVTVFDKPTDLAQMFAAGEFCGKIKVYVIDSAGGAG
jgi:hypothetical protein